MKKLQRITSGKRVFADQAAEASIVSSSKKPADDGRAASAGYVISCRLAAEEVTAFDGICAELGANSRSDGVRLVVRMAAGFLEFSRSDAEHLEGLRQELHRIGTGVNQIALAADRGRIGLVRDQWEAVNELRRALPGMRNLLGQIVAERRRQGVALFREFAAGEDARNG